MGDTLTELKLGAFFLKKQTNKTKKTLFLNKHTTKDLDESGGFDKGTSPTQNVDEVLHFIPQRGIPIPMPDFATDLRI